MLDGLKLEAHEVLGVAPDASPEAIREAYHAKSKKHHPDRGGDEWAFRVVARAYEILSARADGAAPRRAAPSEISRVRPGVHDRGLDPARVVAVEVEWRRY